MYLTDKDINTLVLLFNRAEGVECVNTHWSTLASECLRLEVPGAEPEFEIMITNKRRLVVRRVLLHNHRQGTFSILVSRLVVMLACTQVCEFEVESVITPEMRDWCIKHQMEVAPGHTAVNGGLGCSYVCSFTTLKETLRLI